MKKILFSIAAASAFALTIMFAVINTSSSKDSLLLENVAALALEGEKDGAYYDIYQGPVWLGMCCGKGNVRNCAEESVSECPEGVGIEG